MLIFYFIFCFLIIFCLFFIQLNNHFKLKKQTKIYKINLFNELIQYVEEELIKTEINLENVFIHNGGGGLCFYAVNSYNITKYMDFSYKHSDLKYSNKILPGYGMILPEINDYKNLHTWLHEISHYKLKHLFSNKENYLCEYEADIEAYNLLKEKGLELLKNDNIAISFFKIELIYILKCMQDNIKIYVDDNILPENIQTFLDTEFDWNTKNIL